MDVFQIDSSNISSTITECQDQVDEITEVKFEAHSEFDLNFFETPDDSMTQCSVFSNPNSVESLSASPEPLNGISVSSTTSPSSATAANVVNIKNGKKKHFSSVVLGLGMIKVLARNSFFYLFHFLMLTMRNSGIFFSWSVFKRWSHLEFLKSDCLFRQKCHHPSSTSYIFLSLIPFT